MFNSVATGGKKAREESMSVIELSSIEAPERLTLVEPA